MLKRPSPEIGCWYENIEQGSLFEIVSLDEEENTVAIQYFEGEIEEVELDSFLQLPLRAVEQPEDWAGPYEVDKEDRFESDFDQYGEENNELMAFDDSDHLHIVDDF
ncbi:MAG TPA: DUF6763 family protein [Dongiaceae bacterium]|nr:DUF6763 family protein [Dongiaceae bacterium]